MTIIESEPKLCPHCSGIGVVSGLMKGISANEVICPLCGGSGKIIVMRTIIQEIDRTPKPPYEITC